MGALVTYLMICLAPAAAFYALEKALTWFSRSDGFRPTAGHRPAPAGPSLQRLVDDLRRLEAEYAQVERSTLPAKAHRLRALGLAYDDTLCECCRALGLPPPAHVPLSSWDRVQAEVELARHGLTW